jgi:hypothetical protein
MKGRWRAATKYILVSFRIMRSLSFDVPRQSLTERERQEGVMALLKSKPAENLEITLAQLSVVKGLFNP